MAETATIGHLIESVPFDRVTMWAARILTLLVGAEIATGYIEPHGVHVG